MHNVFFFFDVSQRSRQEQLQGKNSNNSLLFLRPFFCASRMSGASGVHYVVLEEGTHTHTHTRAKVHIYMASTCTFSFLFLSL